VRKTWFLKPQTQNEPWHLSCTATSKYNKLSIENSSRNVVVRWSSEVILFPCQLLISFD
jgi:hypothetical protein